VLERPATLVVDALAGHVERARREHFAVSLAAVHIGVAEDGAPSGPHAPVSIERAIEAVAEGTPAATAIIDRDHDVLWLILPGVTRRRAQRLASTLWATLVRIAILAPLQ
jgi:hypothetical protein